MQNSTMEEDIAQVARTMVVVTEVAEDTTEVADTEEVMEVTVEVDSTEAAVTEEVIVLTMDEGSLTGILYKKQCSQKDVFGPFSSKLCDLENRDILLRFVRFCKRFLQ
ncbi:hypothetical protein J437_LFUL013099 [Ladona fulva]|uniref:Uncharacterized protein n=1 Tax=Ladona fulva TaxID=123851 RepID=A0A8K0KI51_LADFU|nr:hypothetical protein J437_LFUL013099 [Ladona fulva]